MVASRVNARRAALVPEKFSAGRVATELLHPVVHLRFAQLIVSATRVAARPGLVVQWPADVRQVGPHLVAHVAMRRERQLETRHGPVAVRLVSAQLVSG